MMKQRLSHALGRRVLRLLSTAAAPPVAVPLASTAATPAAASPVAAPDGEAQTTPTPPLPPLPSWDDMRVDGVTLVRSVSDAHRVAAIMERVSAAPPPRGGARVVHAWDTEVIDIDLDTQSPVGHGVVICASAFSGPDIDYGTGPRVWVDAHGPEGDAVLRAFGGVLSSPSIRKVWHNYGFDRHVLGNHGINVRGFWGDTMHMARLQNTARLDKATGGGYSLAALSRLLLPEGEGSSKVPMIDLFGRAKKKKNGEDSRIRELPPLLELQRSPDASVRVSWVGYSVRDAEVTWRLYQRLVQLLSDTKLSPWQPQSVCFNDVQFVSHGGRRDQSISSPPVLLDLYERVLQPFGELLTDMERNGIRVDLPLIRAAGVSADIERTKVIARFQAWLSSFTGREELGRFFNVHSDMQKAQLLFGLPREMAKEDEGVSAGGAASTSASAVSDDGGEEGDEFVDVVAEVLPPTPPSSSSASTSPSVRARYASSAEDRGHASSSSSSSSSSPPSPRGRKGGGGGGGGGGKSAKVTTQPPAVVAVDVASVSSSSAAIASSIHPHPLEEMTLGSSMLPMLVGGDSHAPCPQQHIKATEGGDSAYHAMPSSPPPPSTVSHSGLAARKVRAPSSRRSAAPAMLDGGDADSIAVTSSPTSHSSSSSSSSSSPPLSSSGSAQHSPSSHHRSPPSRSYHMMGDGGSSSPFSSLIGLDASASSESDADWWIGSDHGRGQASSGSDSASSSDSDDGEWAPLEGASDTMARKVNTRSSGGSGSSAGRTPPGDMARAVLYGTPLGPSGFVPRTPSPDEDVCGEYEFDTLNAEGWVEPGKAKAKKKRSFSVPSLLFPITDRTPKGRASGTAGAIKKLMGKSADSGVAYSSLLARGCAPEAAAEATARISDLLTLSTIDTVLEMFIRPLEAAASTDPASRVHCSLNLNTETGRLSARRPNLQNQPSLERDKFRIRHAFVAPPGRCLVVADYGQLELRVLAHLTNCKSMIAAFAAGGDFHSRTAMGMFPHVKAAVESGQVQLEEGDSGSGGSGSGTPPPVLLKDRFKEERKKAKVLNFSIAYGKTAFGLAKDWGVSLREAEGLVKAWYADRPEVLAWQQATREGARAYGKVGTIMGRHRDLPGINSRRRLAAHAERAAINTPIQGSAADIVMCAMLKAWRDEELARLGFSLVLQVHDEIILEGPEEHADAALSRLVALMQMPFDAPLLLELTVDAKAVRAWGDAK